MRTAQLTSWLLGSLCALALAGCREDDPKPRDKGNWCGTITTPADAEVKVTYAQTQCADPWGPAQGIQQLQAVASTYLAQQGIASVQLQASAKNPGVVCNACNCPTGMVLDGTVRHADLAAVLALGFRQAQ